MFTLCSGLCMSIIGISAGASSRVSPNDLVAHYESKKATIKNLHITTHKERGRRYLRYHSNNNLLFGSLPLTQAYIDFTEQFLMRLHISYVIILSTLYLSLSLSQGPFLFVSIPHLQNQSI